MNFWTRILKHIPDHAPDGDAEIGKRGERIARQFLEHRGLRVIERNWASRFGEVDLICRDGDTHVFVEVKASRRLGAVSPDCRVDSEKQRRLRRLAQHYLKQRAVEEPVRFDVIAVWWEDNVPRINHIENAF